ncbi:putative RNA-binding, CRM domain-containing protein [Rosa chinensis]|uniref:Putative RNA-binding, CRM domain-containing protein n=1 Tax=Rosa chinensis TaxID=74649 RepID=A0A2P6S5U3_ROSCH|nr:CRM-domain containing factor CFM9, mitochondrial [Rosa chinensis]PRQ54045.1 putative RNA-binding, CRM domain-containing protein [Rosa chinensis]
MFATRSLRRHCFKSLSSLLQFNPSKNVSSLGDVGPKLISSNVVRHSSASGDCVFSSSSPFHPLDGWSRPMSTYRGSPSSRGSASKGRGMRSKVARRVEKETGKTQKEVQRANKIRKKLMTENERRIYNLKRAKRKVALLLQKLKKYELPDLPAPRHDPELFTLEQLQAFKKIGFRNKNYVPVGVRGVFGGVVQNMHMHWKFHETVQVCCDNFPKEKIKEMATMLARLSGGIVINIHNTKTIIMFRGRNYRQPKNLIPFNTLTKRKALFKARFEQALESQKLNIKKIEQELRRSGVNPEDPVAMASIQRVASSFFNAIDQKEGSPYVFHGDKLSLAETDNKLRHLEPPDQNEQEELDKFISEIENAAEREWAAEEAAEKEEFTRLRYWNKEEFGGRYRRSEPLENDGSDDETKRTRDRRDTRGKQMPVDSDYEDDEGEYSNSVAHTSVFDSDADDSDGMQENFKASTIDGVKQYQIGRGKNDGHLKKSVKANNRKIMADECTESENTFSDLENAMWHSDDEEEQASTPSRAVKYDYRSSSDDEEDLKLNYVKLEKKQQVDNADDSDEAHDKFKLSSGAKGKHASEYLKGDADFNIRRELVEEDLESDDLFSDDETAMWESEAVKDSRASTAGKYNYRSSEKEDYPVRREEKGNGDDVKRTRTPKELDEIWDSD